MNGIDIIPYLKSNYEFMNSIISIINLINRNYSPKSIDYSDIAGDKSIFYNESSLCDKDVVIKWNWNKDWNEDKLLITIF